MKVLLITYYWPPAGGGGVQRWLKMSKYFHSNGIELHVYTPSNPEYPVLDNSSVKEISENIIVIKKPIKEPYSIYKKFIGKKKEEKIYSGFINEKPSIKQKLSVWIRGNFFIPDARKFWIKPSVKFLRKYLIENEIHNIISTGPPHSMHLIARNLKRINPELKWVSDFRDPWTNIDFYDQLLLTKWADQKHKKLERTVLQESDKVVTIGYTLAKELNEIRGREDVEIITNGYDHDDFNIEVQLKDGFSITHLGSINKDRNPETLWNALRTLKENNNKLYKELKVNLVGNVDHSILNSIKLNGVAEKVKHFDFMPHNEAIKFMKASHILLLIINNTPNAAGILTGKVFEYLGAQRFILCIGPDTGDIKTLLKPYKNAKYVGYNDVANCIKSIQEIYEKGELDDDSEDHVFTRERLARKYCTLLKELN